MPKKTTTRKTIVRITRVARPKARLVKRKRKIVIRTAYVKLRRAAPGGKRLVVRRRAKVLPSAEHSVPVQHAPPRRRPRPVVSEVTVEERQALKDERGY